MLRGGKDISLEAGQELIVYAAGDEYTTWEGYKDEATGEATGTPGHTRQRRQHSVMHGAAHHITC